MLLCKFCNKECKNNNSLRNHERLCKKNPNRQSTSEWTNKNGNLGKSNQFIKAKEEGRKWIISQSTRDKISAANLARTDAWNKENGKRISRAITQKVLAGEWHTSLAKHMHINYNGVDLHGSWELKYAQYLDSKSIKWDRNTDSFAYEFAGKGRRYVPDFYLPATEEYVEIKGYKTSKDEAKWAQFPKDKKLVIIMKKELEALLSIKL